jgi:predicted glutamine amidotransferase
MCRVLLYKGSPVSLADLLYEPNNSLVKQAYQPQMHNMLSLAGFGMLAWDLSSHRPELPFSYRSVNIPIFDPNLKDLADKLSVTTVIAHVRGVPYRENVTVGEQNLHPFRYKGYRLALAHNGSLAAFERMRFSLLEHIRPEIATDPGQYRHRVDLRAVSLADRGSAHRARPGGDRSRRGTDPVDHSRGAAAARHRHLLAYQSVHQ